MNTLIVLNDVAKGVANDFADWPLAPSSIDIVPAHAYLTDPRYRHAAHVINLCAPTDYLSTGYYVSLLAQARGQPVLPCVKTIEDLHSGTLCRLLMARLASTMQAALASIKADEIDWHLYFGANPDGLAPALARALYRLLPAPLLALRLQRMPRQGGYWQPTAIRSLGLADIPAQHQPFLRQAALDYAARHRFPSEPLLRRRRVRHKPALAILFDPDCQEPPSNISAIDQFQKAARALDMHAEVITRADHHRLADFDALFIRDTTSIQHYTYELSRQAAVSGLVVMDDPDSILKCSNKVYLAELFQRHRISIPKTMLVHRDNVEQVIPTLGLPCILKQPDGAFSLGVVKIETAQQLEAHATALLKKSALILAQQWLPTTFDWRIGVLDRQPLFACKYFMAPGHWQIIKRQQAMKLSEGQTSALPLAQVPAQVLQTALAAANLIGDGFYGVDLKQVGQQCYIIEINDNPNVDLGNEDGVLHDALYRQVMQVFRGRIGAAQHGAQRGAPP